MSEMAFGQDPTTIAFNGKILRAIRAELAGDMFAASRLRGELVGELFAAARIAARWEARRCKIDEHDLESEIGEKCIKAVGRMLDSGASLPRSLAAFGRDLTAKAAIDVWRRGKARAVMQEKLLKEAEHYGTGWADDVTGFEMRSEVEELVRRMTPDERQMLCLPAYGFKDEEIAGILGITVGALQVRRHRWLRKNRRAEA